jgi:hypothetical protein
LAAGGLRIGSHTNRRRAGVEKIVHRSPSGGPPSTGYQDGSRISVSIRRWHLLVVLIGLAIASIK